jgi:short subunit dehydrogenase-like uncharacterized protein
MGKGFHSEDDIASQPSKTVCLTMSGPEPGYLTCSICIVAAARMIVQGDVNLPGGGVFTPASLLSGNLAAYVSLLQERGISFDYQE